MSSNQEKREVVGVGVVKPWPIVTRPMTGGAPGYRDRGVFVLVDGQEVLVEMQVSTAPTKTTIIERSPTTPERLVGCRSVSTDGEFSPWPDYPNAVLISRSPCMDAAMRGLLGIIYDDLTHARQNDHKEAINAARVSIGLAVHP